MLWIVTWGTSLIFKAGWFQIVIRADFWMFGLVVPRVYYKTWQTISTASQYEIWILVISTSWDQRDNQDLLYNDVMTVNRVTLYMKPDTRYTSTISLLSRYSLYLLKEPCPFSFIAIETWEFDWHTCPSTWQHTGLGCRRSSLDAAYELAETVRAQRECRLRPHYSDPMPADASKRIQLEMKIAAAARLHGHRRDRDSGGYMTSVSLCSCQSDWLVFCM